MSQIFVTDEILEKTSKYIKKLDYPLNSVLYKVKENKVGNVIVDKTLSKLHKVFKIYGKSIKLFEKGFGVTYKNVNAEIFKSGDITIFLELEDNDFGSVEVVRKIQSFLCNICGYEYVFITEFCKFCKRFDNLVFFKDRFLKNCEECNKEFLCSKTECKEKHLKDCVF